MAQPFREMFQDLGLIGIFRGITPAEAGNVIAAAVASGLRIVEVPLNSPEALQSIKMLAKRFDEQILVGAGTVISVTDVDKVAAAGGRLVVTPYARPELVERAKQRGLVAVPGAMTPTEMAAMYDCGADAVKIFPAESISPAGVKAIRAIVPNDLFLVPVGGVSLDNMAAYLSAGADGFGVGSTLYRPGDDSRAVARKAAQFVAFMQKQKQRIVS